MLPSVDEFPQRRELAERVLRETRLELEATIPALDGIAELRLFRQKAEDALLCLPFRYCEILDWADDIDYLLDGTDNLDNQIESLPVLREYVHEMIRSNRFTVASSADQATIILAWSVIERRSGNIATAAQVLIWGLHELEQVPVRESTTKLMACMRGHLARVQRDLERIGDSGDSGDSGEAGREPKTSGEVGSAPMDWSAGGDEEMRNLASGVGGLHVPSASELGTPGPATSQSIPSTPPAQRAYELGIGKTVGQFNPADPGDTTFLGPSAQSTTGHVQDDASAATTVERPETPPAATDGPQPPPPVTPTRGPIVTTEDAAISAPATTRRRERALTDTRVSPLKKRAKDAFAKFKDRMTK